MKAIMLSVKPEWVIKIHSKKKIGELRTRIPTCELPFKVYVYETKGTYWTYYTTSNPVLTVPNGGKVEKVRNGEYRIWYKQKGQGKIVSEFIVKTYDKYTDLNNPMNRVRILERCLVDSKELWRYSKKGTKPVFDLHIDDLKIYDEPKELSEFKKKNQCYSNKWDLTEDGIEGSPCWECCTFYDLGECDGRCSSLKRVPQSWCYVEELEEKKDA